MNHQQLKFACLIGIGIVMAAAVGAPVAAELPAAVREDIETCVANRLFIGLVIGIVDNEGPRYYAFGTTDIDGGVRPDEDTIFEIGSVSKVFTAELLAAMVADGDLNLDDAIERYLPEGTTVPRGERSITLLDLATQTSGLPRLPDNMLPDDIKNPYADYGPQDLYDFLAGHELAREPGEAYAYSNLGVGLLGHLLERAAGKRYEALIRDRIAAPLGMASTVIALDAGHPKRLALGHSGVVRAPNWDLNVLAGAGALRSTARDMVAFLQANAGLVESPLKEVMLVTHEPRRATSMSGTQIGLGWQVTESESGDVVWHNGGTGGYRSFAGFVAGERGVVVLSNSDVGADNIGFHLLDPSTEYRRSPTVADVDEGVLARYVGRYELSKGVLLDVQVVHGALTCEVTGQQRYTLFPTSETEFFLATAPARVSFMTDESGVATEIKWSQGGAVQPALKVPEDYQLPEHTETEVNPDMLKDYVGRYELAPGVIFTVEASGSQLMVQLTGQPSIPVYPEGTDKFFYKVVYAQITFERNADGDVTALILHQNNMDQRAPRL